MNHIKTRRLSLPVTPHPDTYVGGYVPFYFCPRSVMLYIIHRANSPDLTFRGGQGPIVHLSAPLDAVLEHVDRENIRWAFSFSNAGARYARFAARVDRFDELDWSRIASTNFSDSTVKEAKQAEFLVENFFPFELIDQIGVCNQNTLRLVREALDSGGYSPSLRVRRNWYY